MPSTKGLTCESNLIQHVFVKGTCNSHATTPFIHIHIRQRGFTPPRLAIPREGHVKGINHEHISVRDAERSKAKADALLPSTAKGRHALSSMTLGDLSCRVYSSLTPSRSILVDPSHTQCLIVPSKLVCPHSCVMTTGLRAARSSMHASGRANTASQSSSGGNYDQDCLRSEEIEWCIHYVNKHTLTHTQTCPRALCTQNRVS